MALVATYLIIALGWVWIACALCFVAQSRQVLLVVLEGMLRGLTNPYYICVAFYPLC